MILEDTRLEDAFNSMLRADYIPLRDTAKLDLLSQYYVDYFGYVRQVLAENDQLIVGRRGTGKTTLLYRSLVDCRRSWNPDEDVQCKPKTLGIYLDLGKCQSLSDVESSVFDEFEHVFLSELREAIEEEIVRSWPAVEDHPGLLQRLFKPDEVKSAKETATALKELVEVIQTGVARRVDLSGSVSVRKKESDKRSASLGIVAKGGQDGISVQGKSNLGVEHASEAESSGSYSVDYRLTVPDVLRVLGRVIQAADASSIIIFVDEFSSLSEELQRRFTTLLRKILGNQEGIFIKLCAITDNYSLGSSIILQ